MASISEAQIPMNSSGPSTIAAPNWFGQRGYAQRFRTHIRPLVVGEAAFAAVARALKGAESSINMAFWGFDPGTVLIRGSGATDYEPENIIGNIMIERARADVKVNLAVWDTQWNAIALTGSGASGIVGDANSVNLGRFHAAQSTIPNLTVKMTNALSGQPGAWASFHQKMIIVDIEDPRRATAFVMGHNMMSNYWDTTDLTPSNTRRDWFYRVNSVGPTGMSGSPVRHLMQPYLDVSAQVWGTAVVDVYHAFSSVWRENGLQEDPEVTSLNSKLTDYNRAAAGTARSPVCQVARTWYPGTETGIRDQYKQSLIHTNKYAFFINQYIRDRELTDDLIATLSAGRGVPALKKISLIMVTMNWDGVAGNEGHDTAIMRRFANAGVPVSLVKMVTRPAAPPASRIEVYVHAKVLIVDDTFTTLGSANYNERSMKDDPEINIGAIDPGLTAGLRRELMNIIIGDAMNGLSDDTDAAYEEWLKQVEENDLSLRNGTALLNGHAVTYAPQNWRGWPTRWAQVTPPNDGTSVT